MTQYLVRWREYGPEFDEWRSITALDNVMDLVEAYERANPPHTPESMLPIPSKHPAKKTPNAKAIPAAQTPGTKVTPIKDPSKPVRRRGRPRKVLALQHVGAFIGMVY